MNKKGWMEESLQARYEKDAKSIEGSEGMSNKDQDLTKGISYPIARDAYMGTFASKSSGNKSIPVNSFRKQRVTVTLVVAPKNVTHKVEEET